MNVVIIIIIVIIIQLQTESVGVIRVDVSVITSGFAEFGVDI